MAKKIKKGKKGEQS
jgi:pescadillo